MISNGVDTLSNHIGEIYRPYIIVGIADEKDTDGHKLYLAHCMYCDTICKMRLNAIQNSGQLKYNCNATHLKNNIKDRRLSGIFRGMKSRCNNPLCPDYKYYGAKGIRLCKEWMQDPSSFEKWAYEHGYANSLTIDRIDSNGPYAPDNCRWITLNDNAKYKSTTSLLDVDGVARTGRDWAMHFGIGINTLNRIRRQHGDEITKELIRRMCIDNPNEINRNCNQSLLDAYGIIH